MHRRTLTLILPLSAALAATPVLAQPAADPVLDSETIAKIQTEGLERSQVMDHLDGLTNLVGHRLTGSDNFTFAVKWARARFEAMGLANAHTEKWATWPITWNRGQWSGRIIEPEPLELQVATPAWTVGTKGRQRGRIVLAPERDGASERAEDYAGAWVWVESLPRSRRGTWIVEWAQQAGALGFIAPATSERAYRNAQYPRRIRVFGDAPRTQDAKIPPLPRIVVRTDQALRIKKMLDAHREVIADFDIRNRARDEPVDLFNVVAEIPGTERPDEVVIVCGHLDSWHQATGTTDNGTGSATTLECARILAAIGAKPKRTIRFCLWGGEEEGLLGSRGYVTRHRNEMDNVSFVFNHDTGTNWWQNMSIDAANYDAMARVVAPIMQMQSPDPEWDGDTFTLRRVQKITGGGGSDHASFVSARVPAISLGLRGRSDYFGYTWHTQWDTYDVAIPEYQRHTATALALAALGVANLPNLLSHENVAPGGGSSPFPKLSDSIKGLEKELAVDLDGEKNLTFARVTPGGRAAKLGIQAGDVLTGVGRRGADLRILYFIRNYDQDVEIRLKRGEEKISIRTKAWGKTVQPGTDPTDTGAGRGSGG